MTDTRRNRPPKFGLDAYFEELRKRDEPAFTTGQLVLLVVWSLLLVAAVVLEFAWDDFRKEMLAHPVTAGIISGGLILAPLVYGVERFAARRQAARDARQLAREQERWRLPAREGVETYVRVAVGATNDIYEEIAAAVEEYLPVATRPTLEQILGDLAKARPSWFEKLADRLASAAQETGALSLSLGPTVSLFPEFADYVNDIAHLHRLLRIVVEPCERISQWHDYPASEDDDPELSRLTREIAKALQERDARMEMLQEHLETLDPELAVPLPPRMTLKWEE